MKISGVLDIINWIAISQLIFFSIYLYTKGKKVPSTFFLKVHLFFQLLGYFNYFFYGHGLPVISPLLLISIPGQLLWAPTLYFYIRSRLYLNFKPSIKLMLHAIPAIFLFLYLFPVLLKSENLPDDIHRLRVNSYYFIKLQILVYGIFTLIIIYRYRLKIKSLTSASEKQKLSWLFLFTYGINLISLADAALNQIPEFKYSGSGFFLFWIFINILFFKAIIQPDQFLGIDEKKMHPVKLSLEKSGVYFRRIDEAIDSMQLYLDPDLSLHNIAQTVKLSDRVVSQTIKQIVEMNFADYINIKRIEYAKETLRNTISSEKNILEVLYESGFNSKSVFNTQFKKHTGQSPTYYRKMMQLKGPSN